MSEIKIFNLTTSGAFELKGEGSDLEKPLQIKIERHLELLLGVRFLSSEYSTGPIHGERIDTLGLDEDNCPVIIEYKRAVSENVINQGLYYLDWLMDHQGEYERLVHKTLGANIADEIDWTSPRLICIATDFTKFDAHAIAQIDRNIDLVRYKLFGQDLFLLENVNSRTSSRKIAVSPYEQSLTNHTTKKTHDKSYAEWVEKLSSETRTLLASIEDYLQALGDDVVRKELKLYAAFKRLKNFACVVINLNEILLYLNLNPSAIELPNIGEDVSQIGHWGTGDVLLRIKSYEDFEQAKPIIIKAYEG